jgi:enoyl-CoA hydratase
LFERLLAEIEAITASTETIGAVVLRGSGQCFSADHDLRDIAARERPCKPYLQSHVIERLANLPAAGDRCRSWLQLYRRAGIGAGNDIIFASDNAPFADTHAKWSLTPIWEHSSALQSSGPKEEANGVVERVFSLTLICGLPDDHAG